MSNRTYLSVDIGTSQTRVCLFDNQRGPFELRSRAQSATTLQVGRDVRSGFIAAVEKLESQTGRPLLDNRKHLMMSESGEAWGVSGAGLTFSAGVPIRTIIIGASEAYSLPALRRLVSFFDCEIVLEINLQQTLNETAQLEAMLAAQADLIVLAGGVEGGAERALRVAIENLRLLSHDPARVSKVQIVYAGNSSLAEFAQREIEAPADFHLAGNILPAIGWEDQSPAWAAMCSAFARVREQQTPGLSELQLQLRQHALPVTFAYGRMARFLDGMRPQGRGVMLLDVGAGGISVTAARHEALYGLRFHPILNLEALRQTHQLSGMNVDFHTTADYLSNLIAHPEMLPATLEEMTIFQAWAQVKIRQALSALQELYPAFGWDERSGLQNAYEPIIFSGELFSSTEALHQVLLTGLGGIMPHGITTFVLDRSQVLAALGALAEVEPLVAAQVLDSDLFFNLGTVVNVDSPDREGSLALTLEVAEEQSSRDFYTVSIGKLAHLGVLEGSRTDIYLSPEESCDVGMGMPGLGGWLTVAGGALGVIIDARGRPLKLPEDDQKRAKLMNDWLWELGG